MAGTHKLITKILQHTKKYIFIDLTKIGIILIYSPRMAIDVLAVVTYFLFDSLREKRSVALTKRSVLHVEKLLRRTG